MKKSDIESRVNQIRNQQQEVVEKQGIIRQQLILLYKNLKTLDNTYDINYLIDDGNVEPIFNYLNLQTNTSKKSKKYIII